jgi:hypothetical protein
MLWRSDTVTRWQIEKERTEITWPGDSCSSAEKGIDFFHPRPCGLVVQFIRLKSRRGERSSAQQQLLLPSKIRLTERKISSIMSAFQKSNKEDHDTFSSFCWIVTRTIFWLKCASFLCRKIIDVPCIWVDNLTLTYPRWHAVCEESYNSLHTFVFHTCLFLCRSHLRRKFDETLNVPTRNLYVLIVFFRISKTKGLPGYPGLNLEVLQYD